MFASDLPVNGPAGSPLKGAWHRKKLVRGARCLPRGMILLSSDRVSQKAAKEGGEVRSALTWEKPKYDR